jgi:hypothetical protein
MIVCMQELDESWKRGEMVCMTLTIEERKAQKKLSNKAYWDVRKATYKRARPENPENHRVKDARYRNSPRGKDVHRTGVSNRRAKLKGIDGSFTAKEFDYVKSYYGHHCLCCQLHEDELPMFNRRPGILERDHVIPYALPGCTNYISNIQPLCRTCNGTHKKGARHMACAWAPRAFVCLASGRDPGAQNGRCLLRRPRLWLRLYGCQPRCSV